MDKSFFYEKTLHSECIYDGKILHVYKDDIELPNKEKGMREIIRHIGGVCVIPITSEGEVICVRQFRYPFGDTIIEIPAGKFDSKNEDHREAALRELREETGCRCEKLTYIGKMYGCPAIIDEVIYMYMAEGLEIGETDPDEDEFVEVVRFPIEKLYRMVLDGEIKDGKTQLAVLKAYVYLNGEKINVPERNQ